MKISRIELCHVAVPFRTPYKLSKRYGTLTNAQAVVVKVHTDDGIVGLGEADPMNPFTEETPATVMAVMRDVIATVIMRQDPTRIGLIEGTLDQCVRGNLMARGAVNMALYDIVGKLHGLPAHALLGGVVRQEIDLLGATGSGTSDEDAAAIEAFIGTGHRCVMLKMGALPIAEDIARMRAAKQRFGADVAIIVDANQGWELAEAVRFFDGVDRGEGCWPDLIEQPISRRDHEGMRHLKTLAHCPLSADEALVTTDDAALLARKCLVDVFSVKVSKNGGISKSKRIAEVAQAFGMGCLMNSMLELGVTQAASLQLGCTLPGLVSLGHAYGSVLRLTDDVTDFGERISRGVVTVPDRPGLGVALDEDKLRHYTANYLDIT